MKYICLQVYNDLSMFLQVYAQQRSDLNWSRRTSISCTFVTMILVVRSTYGQLMVSGEHRAEILEVKMYLKYWVFQNLPQFYADAVQICGTFWDTQ